MFLTANALALQYGVDDRIAKFFVDREPPKDNLYWQGKLLYLRPQPGYIFLPLITDLFYRSGVSMEQLLDEKFIVLLERIGHYSAQQEFDLITKDEAIESCRRLVAAGDRAEPFLTALMAYFNGQANQIALMARPFKALHRGDLFLFGLCELEEDLDKKVALAGTWFALITTLLLLDDAEDYQDDAEKGQENAFIESGSNQEGFDRIKAMLASNLDQLAALNPTMANSLHRQFTALADKPGIKQYLNA